MQASPSDATLRHWPNVCVFDTETKDKHKRYTVYKCLIDIEERSITIFRRYNEFLTLSEKIKKTHPSERIKLPGKRLFRNFDPEVIRARRTALQDFVLKLLETPELRQDCEVRSFLHLDSSHPSSSEETEEEDEAYHSNKSSRNSSVATDLVDLGEIEHSKMKPGDFEFIRVIGTGSFGKVLLARHRTEEKMYAIKVLNKSEILRKNEVRHIMCERRVLEKNIRHPFLVSLHLSFQTAAKLYLVMDYISGGELFFHLQRERRFTETRARFYAAEIASALGYLHEIDIIYRDLKPENILLDSEGHIALTDFGLCKEGAKLALTFCGTPEYLAPEVIKKCPYDRMVDWWCLGSVLYEMMFGLPPYYNRDQREMYNDILHKKLDFNKTVVISEDAQDLLHKLLTKDKLTRLGQANDARDVKSHVFFTTIDWCALDQRKITPPFKPKLVDQFDVSNFDQDFTKQSVPDSVVEAVNELGDSSTTMRSSGGVFQGFSYRPPAYETFSF